MTRRQLTVARWRSGRSRKLRRGAARHAVASGEAETERQATTRRGSMVLRHTVYLPPSLEQHGMRRFGGPPIGPNVPRVRSTNCLASCSILLCIYPCPLEVPVRREISCPLQGQASRPAPCSSTCTSSALSWRVATPRRSPPSPRETGEAKEVSGMGTT